MEDLTQSLSERWDRVSHAGTIGARLPSSYRANPKRTDDDMCMSVHKSEGA